MSCHVLSCCLPSPPNCRQDLKVIGSVSQFLGFRPYMVQFLRSSQNKDKEVFIEKSFFDLRIQYGKSDAGKPGRGLLKVSELLGSSSPSWWHPRRVGRIHVHGPLPESPITDSCAPSYGKTRSTSSTRSFATLNTQVTLACVL